MASLVAGVKAGELHQGYFHANQYNYLEVRDIHLMFISLTPSVGQRSGSCIQQTRSARWSGEYESSSEW